MGSAARNSSANTGTPTSGLPEGDFMASRYDRMFFEFHARGGEVHAVMRAAALFAGQSATCDKQGHRVDVAQLVHSQDRIRYRFRSLGAQSCARGFQAFAGA